MYIARNNDNLITPYSNIIVIISLLFRVKYFRWYNYSEIINYDIIIRK